LEFLSPLAVSTSKGLIFVSFILLKMSFTINLSANANFSGSTLTPSVSCHYLAYLAFDSFAAEIPEKISVLGFI
jgi:hypothetical protein